MKVQSIWQSAKQVTPIHVTMQLCKHSRYELGDSLILTNRANNINNDG